MYRHLHCVRDEAFVAKTQYFIQQVHEQPFVLYKNSKGAKNVIPKDEEEGEKVPEFQQRRLYRQAELIAKFYRYVGLLPSKNTGAVKKNY